MNNAVFVQASGGSGLTPSSADYSESLYVPEVLDTDTSLGQKTFCLPNVSGPDGAGMLLAGSPSTPPARRNPTTAPTAGVRSPVTWPHRPLSPRSSESPRPRGCRAMYPCRRIVRRSTIRVSWAAARPMRSRRPSRSTSSAPDRSR